MKRFSTILAILGVGFVLAACQQTTMSGSSGGVSASAPLLSLSPDGRADINKPGEVFSMVIYGYDRSLGTEKITDGKLPAQYGKELWDKANLANTGVEYYSGECLTFRLIHVVGVTGTAQVLKGNNAPAGTINMKVGSTFEVCGGSPSKTVLALQRAAWSGKDPVVCYELVTPGYTLPALPKKVEGPFAGRHNVDCTLEGQIKQVMNGRENGFVNTHIRMHTVIARGAPAPVAPPAPTPASTRRQVPTS